ncbi:hypothetical protein ACH3XW_12585 [Acanthocheilonema viteae]
MIGVKLLIALIFILQIEQAKQIKQTRHEQKYKIPSASHNFQCNYDPFSRSNGFSANKTKALMKNVCDLLNKTPKQINKITKWLCIFIKHNANAILCGSIIFLGLNILGVLLVIILHNLKIMFELQNISRNNKILQVNLQAMLRKINRSARLSDSKMIRSLTGNDATTQTFPTLCLFRTRELNERGIK